MLNNVRVWSREASESLRLRLLRRDRVLKIVAVWALTGLNIFLIVHYLPYGLDWRGVFRPATHALLQLESPYSIGGYFNPPWAVIPLIPLAILPESIGYALLILFSLTAFSYTAHCLGAKPSTIILLLLSPPVLHSLLNGNIDALAVIGFALPPQIGLFFVLIKPQIGIALAVYWMIEAWRQGGIRQILRTFGPVTIVLISSFLLYDLWPLRFEQEIHLWWNASLWPASIPVGLALLVIGLIRRQKNYAIAASPFLSPYVLLHAWVGALLAFISSEKMTLVAVIGLWVLVALRLFS